MNKDIPASGLTAAAPASRGWLRGRMAAWVGIILLAFNLLAGEVLPAHFLPPSNDPTAIGFDYEICAAYGQADHQSGNQNSPANSHGGQICVFCLPLLHGGLGLPMAAVAVVPPQAAPRRLALAQEPQQAVSARVWPSASPRAPPLA